MNVYVAKRQLTDKQIEALCAKGKTSLIKGFINKQSKPFDAMLKVSEETRWRTEFEFEK